MNKVYCSVEEPYDVETAFEEARKMVTDSNYVDNTQIFWNDPVQKEGVIPSVLNRAENLMCMWYLNDEFEDVY